MTIHHPGPTMRQQTPWKAGGNSALRSPELHDFSDLRGADGQPRHPLRWALALLALLVIGQVVASQRSELPVAQANPELLLSAASH
ncbi:hypothetical protein [Siccirubricoccus sp. G192]|uniref:hypothetical protein n=1 Tax=Siccirubricoccus sp. G192 TaxID=2849651 RepID=UPI001C2BC286|nr:hypothetical protein [Siccirubricoccus sp. G192]MBV1795976.1 hypothetical protein [Siccirubricoccus sp. G192]